MDNHINYLISNFVKSRNLMISLGPLQSVNPLNHRRCGVIQYVNRYFAIPIVPLCRNFDSRGTSLKILYVHTFLNICCPKILVNCLLHYHINNFQYLYNSTADISIVTLPDEVLNFFCDWFTVWPRWRCKFYNKVMYKRFWPASEHVGPPGCPSGSPNNLYTVKRFTPRSCALYLFRYCCEWTWEGAIRIFTTLNWFQRRDFSFCFRCGLYV